MNFNPIILGVWDVPIENYWIFYFCAGIIAFALCFYQRAALFAVAPILLWFCVADIHSFYYQDVGSKDIGPDGDYIFGVALSMAFAFSLAGLGTYLNWRKHRFDI